MKKTALRLMAGMMAVLLLTGCGSPAAQSAPDIEPTANEARLPEITVYADAMAETSDPTQLYNALAEYYTAIEALHNGARELMPDMAAFTARTAAPIFAGKSENTVFSPSSLYLAMAMLADATDGETRSQIAAVLDAPQYAEAANALWRMMYENGATVALPANALWSGAKWPVKQSLANQLASSYYADSFTVPMGTKTADELMQSWLNEHTGGQLTQQAQSVQSDADTALALMSTLYFRGFWLNEFMESSTAPAPFTLADGSSRTADFMHAETSGSWHQGKQYVSSSLYFTDGGSMLLVLPDEGILPEELLGDPDAMQDMLTAIPEQYTYIHWAVPKFDVSSQLDLAEPLQALGITHAFDAALADFSPTTEETAVSLSSAQQAARVSIDERGCTAAAFTVMMGVGAGMPNDYILDMKLDRPFLFVLFGSSQVPLFVGTVYTP